MGRKDVSFGRNVVKSAAASQTGRASARTSRAVSQAKEDVAPAVSPADYGGGHVCRLGFCARAESSGLLDHGVARKGGRLW